MRAVADLPTPAVLIDLDRVERNLARMAEAARDASVRLRPHAKTHKVLEIGRLQLAAGAAGLSLAKVSEAEVFAAAGFDDIFLAYPTVGEDRARRLLALSDRIRIAELPGIRLRGVFTHGGQAYSAETPEDAAEVGRSEGETVARVARELRDDGIPVEEVSVGSTPTALSAMRVEGVTECRPGNYVYYDGSQVALGTCRLEDCAMTVIARVVSAPVPDRAVLDAGSKTLSSDALRPRAGGHGRILGTSSRIERLSEEHGVVQVAPGDRFRVGERVRILPNHACVVSNLHDVLYAVRGDRVEAELRVAARGKVT